MSVPNNRRETPYSCRIGGRFAGGVEVLRERPRGGGAHIGVSCEHGGRQHPLTASWWLVQCTSPGAGLDRNTGPARDQAVDCGIRHCCVPAYIPPDRAFVQRQEPGRCRVSEHEACQEGAYLGTGRVAVRLFGMDHGRPLRPRMSLYGSERRRCRASSQSPTMAAGIRMTRNPPM